MRNNKSLGCLIVLGVILLIGFALFVQPWLLMLLWNWIVPAVFSGPTISYWQAFGITLLISILTGGIKITYKRS